MEKQDEELREVLVQYSISISIYSIQSAQSLTVLRSDADAPLRPSTEVLLVQVNTCRDQIRKNDVPCHA
jgi:hypothetical protein